MVAVIKAGTSLKNTLHYNEHKLKQGVAELIHSSGYGKDTDQLGFTDKIRTLEMLTRLNQRTQVNSVHISLNFDPSEKLSKDKLRDIADAYMVKIGFGDQPYLVYQHHDSGHPHIHLVTTNIRRDGSRIDLHNIGRDVSEPARKAIEKEFKLVRAQREQLKQVYELKPVNVQKVIYGKSETKRAITNVLDAVLPAYKYASLPELNAVLKQYNVLADRGSTGSRIYKNGGLIYRVLNEKGQAVGAPVKASDIYSKPTLKDLEKKFQANEPEKQKHKLRVKNAIDLALVKRPGMSMPDLIHTLQKERIQVVLRQNAAGTIYGMTYVDYQTKCVFNGSDLGKEYSAGGIQHRLKSENQVLREQPPQHKQKQRQILSQERTIQLPSTGLSQVIGQLMQPESESSSLPYELRKDLKQKRKRKRLHL